MEDVKNIFVTNFARRHFAGKSSVTQVRTHSPSEFAKSVNKELAEFDDVVPGLTRVLEVKPGHFPDFSRLIKLSNPTFSDARVTVMPITEANHQYLRTDYSARSEKELPVLSRWLELPPMLKPSIAEYLTIALYSRKKLISECLKNGEESEKLLAEDENFINNMDSVLEEFSDVNAKKMECFDNGDLEQAAQHRAIEKDIISDNHLDKLSKEVREELLTMRAPWGVVAIMAHDTEEQEPMNPITIMRNALGEEHGGNGVELDEDYYRESVEFWRTHANVK